MGVGRIFFLSGQKDISRWDLPCWNSILPTPKVREKQFFTKKLIAKYKIVKSRKGAFSPSCYPLQRPWPQLCIGFETLTCFVEHRNPPQKIGFAFESFAWQRFVVPWQKSPTASPHVNQSEYNIIRKRRHTTHKHTSKAVKLILITLLCTYSQLESL